MGDAGIHSGPYRAVDTACTRFNRNCKQRFYNCCERRDWLGSDERRALTISAKLVERRVQEIGRGMPLFSTVRGFQASSSPVPHRNSTSFIPEPAPVLSVFRSQ
jgi:threonine dehydrogenase-like Zn-dependent dehydrogenase